MENYVEYLDGGQECETTAMFYCLIVFLETLKSSKKRKKIADNESSAHFVYPFQILFSGLSYWNIK